MKGNYYSALWGPWPSLFARWLQSFCQLRRGHTYTSASQSRHAQRKAKGGVDFSSRQLSAARLHLPPGQQKY